MHVRECRVRFGIKNINALKYDKESFKEVYKKYIKNYKKSFNNLNKTKFKFTI